MNALKGYSQPRSQTTPGDRWKAFVRLAPVLYAATLAFSMLPSMPALAAPVDSSSCRVWFTVSHPHKCQVRVNIFDLRGERVRKFLDTALAAGIYNYYWDKLNDSGAFVPQGNYRAVINDCGKASYEKLAVAYLAGERDLRVIPQPLGGSSAFQIIVLADTVRPRVEIQNFADSVVDIPMDKVPLAKGVHQFQWSPTGKHDPGGYRLRLTVKDVTHLLPFRYMP